MTTKNIKSAENNSNSTLTLAQIKEQVKSQSLNWSAVANQNTAVFDKPVFENNQQVGSIPTMVKDAWPFILQARNIDGVQVVKCFVTEDQFRDIKSDVNRLQQAIFNKIGLVKTEHGDILVIGIKSLPLISFTL